MPTPPVQVHDAVTVWFSGYQMQGRVVDHWTTADGMQRVKVLVDDPHLDDQFVSWWDADKLNLDHDPYSAVV